MKTCTICNKEHTLDNFLADKHAAGGYRNQCKPCLRIRNKGTWDKRHTGYNEGMRRFRETWKGATTTSYGAARLRAIKSGMPFDITLPYIRELLEQQQYRCALTDDQLVLKGGWAAPSLDKINPVLGYVQGNIQWLSQRANLSKSNLTNQQFLDLCKRCLERSETIPQGSTP